MDHYQVISHNLKRLRSVSGMTQKEISASAGISRQAYIGIENGTTKEPRVSNLQSIADVFDVQIVDLFAEPPKLNTVRFRTNSIRTKKDEAKKHQYLIDAAIWLKDFNFLQSIVGDTKEYKLKNLMGRISNIKDNRPVKVAELAREALGLKDGEPIGDIVSLMENAGIKIKLRSFDLNMFFGFSVSQSDGGPAIIVNSDEGISVERQIFTVAHELGHLLLHPQAYDSKESADSNQEEVEANYFAAHFLMPPKAFKKKLKESYGLGFVERVLHIKRYFRVSYLTVLRRLSDMEIADYATLTVKFRTIYKNKYRQRLDGHKEPFGLEKPDITEDYLSSLVRKALDKDEITVSRAASILNESLMNMREIINSWADLAA